MNDDVYCYRCGHEAPDDVDLERAFPITLDVQSGDTTFVSADAGGQPMLQDGAFCRSCAADLWEWIWE